MNAVHVMLNTVVSRTLCAGCPALTCHYCGPGLTFVTSFHVAKNCATGTGPRHRLLIPQDRGVGRHRLGATVSHCPLAEPDCLLVQGHAAQAGQRHPGGPGRPTTSRATPRALRPTSRPSRNQGQADSTDLATLFKSTSLTTRWASTTSCTSGSASTRILAASRPSSTSVAMMGISVGIKTEFYEFPAVTWRRSRPVDWQPLAAGCPAGTQSPTAGRATCRRSTSRTRTSTQWAQILPIGRQGHCIDLLRRPGSDHSANDEHCQMDHGAKGWHLRRGHPLDRSGRGGPVYPRVTR